MHTILTEYDEEKAMEFFKQEAYKDGEADGLAKGESIGFTKLLISQICKKISKGKSVEQIVDELEEDASTIQEIYNVAIAFGPDYDVEKILSKLNK